MGEARRRRLAGDTLPEETPSELSRPVLGDLRKAHIPTAVAYVNNRVRFLTTHRYGATGTVRRNYELWEEPTRRITPCVLWEIAMEAIAECKVLDSDRVVLRRHARSMNINGKTLEQLNVALGGRAGTMPSLFYGEP